MKAEDNTLLLVIATLTLVELTLIAVIGYRIYQKVAPTINGLQGDYQGIAGIINLISGATASKPASTP